MKLVTRFGVSSEQSCAGRRQSHRTCVILQRKLRYPALCVAVTALSIHKSQLLIPALRHLHWFRLRDFLHSAQDFARLIPKSGPRQLPSVFSAVHSRSVTWLYIIYKAPLNKPRNTESWSLDRLCCSWIFLISLVPPKKYWDSALTLCRRISIH